MADKTPALPAGSGQGPRRWSKESFKNAFLAAWSRVDSKGIPWQLAYAVSALETGNGNGNVFQNSNNLFSILASPAWKGPTYRGRPNSLTANPAGDSHRVYPDFEASMADWIRLMRIPHYARAYAAALANRPQLFFQELQAAGYAGTNKVYAQSLERTFKEVA